MKIVLATNNIGKLEEFNDLFHALKIEFISQAKGNVPEIAETGTTFVENALLKAKHASLYTSLPVLADDSGLSVDALNGAPGVYSARYAGEKSNAQEKIQKLLNELKNVPAAKRTARYHCALVLLRYKTLKEPIIVETSWEGQILFEPRGSQGFGYDPIFYIPELNCSVAELNRDKKNQLSHRGKALRKLIQIITENHLEKE